MKRFALLSVVVFMFVIAAIPSTFAQITLGELPAREGTEWGELVSVGDGAIQTFVTLDPSGDPTVVGVYFTAGMLTGLPTSPSDGKWDVVDASGNVIIPCCGHEFVLDFPPSVSATPFNHFVINWEAHGHEPPGVYDVPHFDLHFYTISNEERMQLVAAKADTMCSVPNPPDVGGEHPVLVTCEMLEHMIVPLPDQQIPPGYFSAGAVSPSMGNHLINGQAPELNGEPFTYTWIYGTTNGRMSFYEPMITLAFLEERNEETCTSISMPEAMPEPGFYPSQYCIRYFSDQNAYAVTMESFVQY